MDHDRSRSIIIQVGWNSWFMIFFLWSWDSSWMDPASFKHDSSIIFTWFWSDFDMIFWWFSNDFLNILEWSQKHFCKSSGAVLDLAQNRSYRALVNRNPGFQAQLRSLYRPDHPGPTSPKSPGLVTLNSPSQEGHHVSPFKAMGGPAQ